jgi:hypothetical protein
MAAVLAGRPRFAVIPARRAVPGVAPDVGTSNDHVLSTASARDGEERRERCAGETRDAARGADRSSHGSPAHPDSPARGRHRPKIAEGRTAHGANTVLIAPEPSVSM